KRQVTAMVNMPNRTVTDESVCTPDSVTTRQRATRGGRSSISACRRRQALAAYPQARTGHPQAPARATGSLAALLGLAPGGVYRATPVTRGAGGLLPHRFTLTGSQAGGLFSVALSRGSPRVAVSNHPALWSPDVPRRRSRAPPTRPPDRLARPVQSTAVRSRPADPAALGGPARRTLTALMGPGDVALLLAAGLAAGTVNAVAGGGSLVT